ncbi:TonB-dependent receptor [bacterium]|nr:TonB-dependent receptor [bacterium]
MKKGLLTLFLMQLFFASLLLASTKGKIAGRVVDAETGVPLVGVNVLIEGTSLGAATDMQGDYVIINVPIGRYTVIARMMGYDVLRQAEVIVSADRTIRVNFSLKQGFVEGEGVTIVAEKEVVAMDLSSSIVSIRSEELESMPQVRDIADFVNMQAGVDGWSIRGGGQSETQFMMDGLMMVDNRTNQAIASPNLSSVAEINIMKGGFDAEYGNVRSGIISVITKKGDRNKYHGSLDFQHTPARYKHHGNPINDPMNYYLRPYMDETNDLCWLGTEAVLAEDERKDVIAFQGWNQFAADKGYGTAEDWRNVFIWERRLPGANKLTPDNYQGKGPREFTYGDKADMLIDAGFGGPVPGLGKKVTFFSSFRLNRESFALPTYRDYYQDYNAQIKLNYYITPEMELEINGLFGETNTMSRTVSGGTGNNYMRSGNAILYSSLTGGEGDRSAGSLYLPNALAPFDVKRQVIGGTFTHALNPSTFYTLRFTTSHLENKSDTSWYDMRSDVEYNLKGVDSQIFVNEAPYGLVTENLATIDGENNLGGIQASQRDYSESRTYNFKFDMTSQIDKYNQVKFGVEYNYDDNKTRVGSEELYTPTVGFFDSWNSKAIRGAAYVQDKIEYEGMVARVGLRLDYFNPNTDWFTETYSEFFTKNNKYRLDEAPQKAAKTRLYLSPRFGISHPISEQAKLYFNYGHFYSLAGTRQLFGIGLSTPVYPLNYLGNPNLEMQKTIAYELGFEYDLFGEYLIHVSGYYKDNTNQIGSVSYTGIAGWNAYSTLANNNYEDVRGFEIQLRKRYGRWFTGFVNYDYRIQSWGYIGRSAYYEDIREQQKTGKYEIEGTQSDTRPVIRANVTLHIPEEYGQLLGGWHISMLFSWRDGAQDSWHPDRNKRGLPEYHNNVEWVDYYMFDAKFSKDFAVMGQTIEFYGMVNNLFNIKQMNRYAFANAGDREDYYMSLHLPIYDDPKYSEGSNVTGGNDKLGAVKGDGKDYINMPNRGWLTYLNPRAITVGLRYKF